MYKNIENMLITILKTSCEIWWDFVTIIPWAKKTHQQTYLYSPKSKHQNFEFKKKKEWKKNMKFSNVSVQLEIQYTKLSSRAS
jgi:hypothetical protein